MGTFAADIIQKPEWKAIIAKAVRDEQKREEAKAEARGEKREQDDSAEWLAWKREMEAKGPGFVACEIMPNWLNRKVPGWLAGQIRKMQRRLAYEAATLW